jgi:hypothetical protein
VFGLPDRYEDLNAFLQHRAHPHRWSAKVSSGLFDAIWAILKNLFK